jgi:DNA-binding YbaB/EbfC family protein
MINKGNMTQMLKQARDMQKKIEQVQSELDELEVAADAGGGLIKVVVNGKQQILELNISPETLDEDKELLEDLIISAINKALSKSVEESQNRMNEATGSLLGGLNIPGLIQ